MDWKSVVTFLDAILGKFDWYKKLKELVVNVIVLIEVTENDEESQKKKKDAVNAVLEAIKQFGISLPIPDWVAKLIIDLMIDAVVAFLNMKYGHDWIKKIGG